MAIQWNIDGMILVNIAGTSPNYGFWRFRLLQASSNEMGELSSKTIEIINFRRISRWKF